MSRICGKYLQGTNETDTAGVAGMLDKARSKPDWNLKAEALGGADMGWTGWREPSLYRKGPFLVALDGMIYNRRELGGEGNDARLFARLYERSGFEESLARINGDFALALFDQRENALWLARDRVGFKPLYYASISGGVAFASRCASLFALPELAPEADPFFVARFAALHYRQFDNDPEASPYKGVRQVPAGCALKFKNGSVEKKTYWSLREEEDFDLGEDALAERYRELLLDAVRLRLDSAPDSAHTLSGGMDSSSVLACAVRHAGKKRPAYSTVYQDATYDESREIESMLDCCVSTWNKVRVDQPPVFDLVARMVALHDEPVATATWLSHYLLCRQVASNGHRGLFGGLGGDELNAGEYEYFFFYFADLKRKGSQDLLDEEIAKWAGYHDHPIYKKDKNTAMEGIARLVDLNQAGKCMPDMKRMHRYLGTLNRGYFDLEPFRPDMPRRFSSYLKSRTWQDIFFETAPCCLRAEDRHSTGMGLDHFLPFFDHRLLEFMYRVPGEMKIRKGVTKHLLRKAMHGILPEETRTRIAKTGWNAPAHVWFTEDAMDDLLDMVHSRAFKERGVYDVDEVLKIIARHREIVTKGLLEDNHMMFLWQLVNLETWLGSL